MAAPPLDADLSLRFPEWVIDGARQLGLNYTKLRVMPSSYQLCLMPYQMLAVSAILRREFPDAVASGIDATANIGCDTLWFTRALPGAPRMSAIELDAATFECLRWNMARATEIAGTHSVCTAVHADCVAFLAGALTDELPCADFVYFDPPWGCPELKWRRRVLMLGATPLHDVVGDALARGNAPVVIVKLPVNAGAKQFTASLEQRMRAPVAVTVYDVRKPNRSIAYRLLFVRKAARTG